MEPRLAFITPVYKRFALTRACLEQRRAMIDALPFEATCVVVGDDENLATARALGFEVVRKDNKFVAAKFNAGYGHAIRKWRATHVMPIGSDSFLHEGVFAEAEWQERVGLALIGLSSVAPWGDERLDLQIKYPAGFGVGMVYPAFAITQGQGAAPHLQRGIDTSTWSRCGRGRVQIAFQPPHVMGYTNFHSPDEQITDYYAVRGVHSRNCVRVADPWLDLIEKYGEHARAAREVYVAASLAVFLTGERPEQVVKINSALPGHKGRKPRPRAGGRQRIVKKGIPYMGTYTEIVENFRGIKGTP